MALDFHRVTQTRSVWPLSSVYDLAVPSSRLFDQFCTARVREWRLEELRVRSSVASVQVVSIKDDLELLHHPAEGSSSTSSYWYFVELTSGARFLCWSVACCIGNSTPCIPAWASTARASIPDLPPSALLHSSELIQRCFVGHENGLTGPVPRALSSNLPASMTIDRLLIVGGGLTAAQMVCHLLATSASSSLRIDWSIRSHLRVKAFDVDLPWVSSQSANACMAKFHALESTAEKVAAIRSARQGGSITHEVKQMIDDLQASGRLRLRTLTDVQEVR